MSEVDRADLDDALRRAQIIDTMVFDNAVRGIVTNLPGPSVTTSTPNNVLANIRRAAELLDGAPYTPTVWYRFP